MPQDIGSLAELDRVRATNGKGKLIVIDFYATWCGPCRTIAPKVELMEKEYGNVVFLKVDVDVADDVSEKFKISVMPTFIFERDGQVLETIQGANESKLREAIQKHSA